MGGHDGCANVGGCVDGECPGAYGEGEQDEDKRPAVEEAAGLAAAIADEVCACKGTAAFADDSTACEDKFAFAGFDGAECKECKFNVFFRVGY